MKKVVIATNNPNKVREIREILNLNEYSFITLNECGIKSSPDENADTFSGNALIKARAAHIASHGMAALADDSGLCVDALNGAPGVYSARYAGDDANDDSNNALLLKRMSHVSQNNRSARFICAIAFVDEDGTEFVVEGSIEGQIGFNAKGNEGFGYDPLFYPDGLNGLSFAEIAPEMKNILSHRARALEELKKILCKENNIAE